MPKRWYETDASGRCVWNESDPQVMGNKWTIEWVDLGVLKGKGVLAYHDGPKGWKNSGFMINNWEPAY